MGGHAGTDVGSAGEAGAATQCGDDPVGTFCVQGAPAEDGDVDLAVGMPLAISLHTTGCLLYRCSNEIVRARCDNVISSGREYWISPDVCVPSDGEVCTADECGGVADTSCETGITLEAGQYTVALGGSPVSVEFTVPSHVAPSRLCR